MTSLSTPLLVVLAILLFPLVLVGSIALDLFEAEPNPGEAHS
ncbi:hypothetical protein P2318_06155 [Myxococcaceae bacterium GXIMD 01537]